MKHEFQPGESLLTETIALPCVSGGYVRGAGGSDFVTNSAQKNDECHSRVKVGCEPGIWLQGSGQEVGDVCLVDDGNKRTGILLSRPAGKKGLNSHRAKISSVHLEGLGTGISLGLTPTEAGCDSCVLERISASDCDVVIRNATRMAMANTFTGIDTMRCGVVVDAPAGGCNTIDRPSVTTVEKGKRSVILRTGEGKYISHNNGQWNLYDAKVDSQAAGRVTLIEMTDYANCTFDVRRGISSNHPIEADYPQFVMMGQAKLNITGRKLYPHSVLVLGNQTLIIEITACDLEGDDDIRSIIHPDSTGKVKIVVASLTVPSMARQIEVASGLVVTR